MESDKNCFYIYFRTSEFGLEDPGAQYGFALRKLAELPPLFLHPHPFLNTLIITDKKY